MTAEEAINEIKKQSEIGINGFQVLSMDEEDVEMYGDDDLKKRFSKMTNEQKAKMLSLLMDEIYDTMEESEPYGFGNMFRDTLIFLDGEDRRKELYAECESVK